jgi:hypothetical protein
MKSKIKVFGIIALVAVIGLMMSNCNTEDDQKVPKMVRAKYLVSGDPNSSAGRSILPNRSVARGVEGGIEGAEKLEELYTKLGDFKESITPTKLELPLFFYIFQKGVSREESGGGGVHYSTVRLAGGSVIDLAQPTVVSSLEVEPGDYVYAELSFVMTGLWLPDTGMITSRISFPIPEGFNYETHVFNVDPNYSNITIEGNIITGDLHTFEPLSVNLHASRHGNEDATFLEGNVLGSIHRIFMGGTVYKAFNALPSTPVIKIDTYLPGFPDDLSQLNDPDDFNFIIPFSGITVPENANAVRFEIYWNIDGIIERYEGATSSPDDDIFILKNRFWEDFSIKAFIE